MTTESMRDRQKPGFALLLQDIGQKLVAGMPLGEAMDIILTLDGRHALSFGIQSLTANQLALYENARELPLLAPCSPIEEDGTYEDAPLSGIWYLGIWSYGRIWLSHRKPDDAECRLLAMVDVPGELSDAVMLRAVHLLEERSCCDDQVEDFFEQLDAHGAQQVLYEVHEAVDHTDPMLLYIDDALFSNFGKFNNLQERNADLPDCFHRRAREMPVDEWTWNEKRYVFCLYWLRVAGCRGEEFCGRQLTPALLDKYFDERLAQYPHGRQAHDAANTSIAGKARLLAQCRIAHADSLLTYRWVNGLNFYKEERLLPRVCVPDPLAWMPPALRAWLVTTCGVDPAQHDSLQSLFDACVARMAASGFTSDEPSLNAVEKMLKVIVDCAIAATGSDVGMTRGTRDVARMQQAFAAARHEDICAWPAADYFCAVFPSPVMQERLQHKPDLLVKILYACSGRMQFNHWHYMPGHCPRDQVPADRHFYLPPRMPDIAVWSDQHHAGHVLAEVRHSIRSPAPLAFNGKTYAGLVDLRLFRQRGEPYTEQELTVALMHTEYVRALHQAVSDHLAQGKAPLCITAFDKDWYRNYYGSVAATTHSHPRTAPAEVIETVSPPPPIDTELFHLLCAHAAGEERTAMIESRTGQPDVAFGYRTLVAHAVALRHAMHRHGVRPDARIAILSQRPLHQAVAIVAGMAAGVIVTPLNPGLSESVLGAQLLHADPDWLIVDDKVAVPPLLGAHTRCVAWRELFDSIDRIDVAKEILREHAATTGNPGGLLIYTSGTTGTAKGVLLNWSHIAANARFAIQALGYTPGWVTGSLLPRFHLFAIISDLFAALLLGGKVVLTDSFDLRHVKWIVDTFRRYQVQSYSAAPVILDALCAIGAWEDAPAMRMAVSGAAPLKEKTRTEYETRFGHPIIPCYGLSETTCFAAISPPDAIRPGAAGLPAGIDIKVVDENDADLDCDLSGELLMRGPSVIHGGYFNDAEGQFAHAFTPDGWFRSGDIGHIDADGYVYVTGRKKNMVIRGGEKVYLEDVDRCLVECLGVLDCASVVQCDAQSADLALTFIVTGGAPLKKEEITAHIRTMLTAQHVPDRVYIVDRIPRTPSGKASHPEMLALAKALSGSRQEPA